MQLNFLSAWSIRVWEMQFGCDISDRTGFGENICYFHLAQSSSFFGFFCREGLYHCCMNILNDRTEGQQGLNRGSEQV